MVIYSKDLPVEQRTGERLGTSTKFLSEEQMHKRVKIFSRIVLKPGSMTQNHQHVGNFEVLYFLSGKAELDDNGVKKHAKPGDVMFTDDGEFHAVKNIGKTDLEYIALVVYS